MPKKHTGIIIDAGMLRHSRKLEKAAKNKGAKEKLVWLLQDGHEKNKAIRRPAQLTNENCRSEVKAYLHRKRFADNEPLYRNQHMGIVPDIRHALRLMQLRAKEGETWQ